MSPSPSPEYTERARAARERAEVERTRADIDALAAQIAADKAAAREAEQAAAAKITPTARSTDHPPTDTLSAQISASFFDQNRTRLYTDPKGTP